MGDENTTRWHRSGASKRKRSKDRRGRATGIGQLGRGGGVRVVFRQSPIGVPPCGGARGAPERYSAGSAVPASRWTQLRSHDAAGERACDDVASVCIRRFLTAK